MPIGTSLTDTADTGDLTLWLDHFLPHVFLGFVFALLFHAALNRILVSILSAFILGAAKEYFDYIVNPLGFSWKHCLLDLEFTTYGILLACLFILFKTSSKRNEEGRGILYVSTDTHTAAESRNKNPFKNHESKKWRPIENDPSHLEYAHWTTPVSEFFALMNSRLVNPNGKKILIFDEDRVYAKALSFTLRKSGFFVLYEENFQICLNAIEKLAPDLIIIDIKRLNPNELHLVTRIHKDPKLMSIPIILVAKTEEKVEDLALRSFPYTKYIDKNDGILIVAEECNSILEKSKCA